MGKVRQKSDGKGSLKDMQLLINEHPDLLNNKIRQSIPSVKNIPIDWLSPLRTDNFSEYRDDAFIDLLKLSLTRSLLDFWPKRGPQWDALGKSKNGMVLLVEAKANIKEIKSQPSKAKPKSKELILVRRYLPTLKIPHSEKYTTEVFNYVMPAFDFVSEELNLNEIKHNKTNAFYKQYAEGIRLARLILKRFGYNITNTQQTTILTPPFWIDMSKLFELYVLGLLKDRFGKDVDYHINTNYQELDYLLNSKDHQMVVDAKYKTIYQTHYDKDDIRQISGYARMKSVYKKLGKDENEIIDCLIIYPDQKVGHENLTDVDLKKSEIEKFNRFYKVPVKIPVLQTSKI